MKNRHDPDWMQLNKFARFQALLNNSEAVRPNKKKIARKITCTPA